MVMPDLTALRIEQRLGQDAGRCRAPFLSVVTRCYRRPNMLAKNVASLDGQSDADFEQIFLIDEQGVGVYGANAALARAQPRGEYVLILDDDDMLGDTEAIAVLRQAVTENNRPQLVIFRARHDRLGLLPSPRSWGKGPQLGHIGSCDFIAERALWQRHIAAFGVPAAGDYAFARSMWREGPDVVWLDRELAAVQRISRGAPE